MYCVYCYINNINNKRYIGQTKDVKRRCKISNYKGCTKFYRALQKYGLENFTFVILEDNLSLEEANKKEEYYISLFNTVEDGYNLKSGGLNNVYSTESRQKMSNSCSSKRKIQCVETGIIYDSAKEIERQLGFANTNIISACLGKLITAYGYHWIFIDSPIEQKKDKRKKEVICIETGEIFESAAAAARAKKCSRPNISHCCAGKLSSAGGYTWKFYIKDEEDKDNECKSNNE